jgi:hypothetical protein
MIDRRAFFRRTGLVLGAALVLDPLELIERLAPRRLYVPGGLVVPETITLASPFGPRVDNQATTVAELNALMKRVYSEPITALGDPHFEKLFRQHLDDHRGIVTAERAIEMNHYLELRARA